MEPKVFQYTYQGQLRRLNDQKFLRTETPQVTTNIRESFIKFLVVFLMGGASCRKGFSKTLECWSVGTGGRTTTCLQSSFYVKTLQFAAFPKLSGISTGLKAYPSWGRMLSHSRTRTSIPFTLIWVGQTPERWLTSVGCSHVRAVCCAHFPLRLKESLFLSFPSIYFLLNWNSKSLSWGLNKIVLFHLFLCNRLRLPTVFIGSLFSTVSWHLTILF